MIWKQKNGNSGRVNKDDECEIVLDSNFITFKNVLILWNQ
jgi:hypothetical protein